MERARDLVGRRERAKWTYSGGGSPFAPVPASSHPRIFAPESVYARMFDTAELPSGNVTVHFKLGKGKGARSASRRFRVDRPPVIGQVIASAQDPDSDEVTLSTLETFDPDGEPFLLTWYLGDG